MIERNAGSCTTFAGETRLDSRKDAVSCRGQLVATRPFKIRSFVARIPLACSHKPIYHLPSTQYGVGSTSGLRSTLQFLTPRLKILRDRVRHNRSGHLIMPLLCHCSISLVLEMIQTSPESPNFRTHRSTFTECFVLRTLNFFFSLLFLLFRSFFPHPLF